MLLALVSIVLLVAFLAYLNKSEDNVNPGSGQSWNDVHPRSSFGGNRFEFEEFATGII